MPAYISSPYLPSAKVTLAVGGFTPNGVRVIQPPKLNALPEPVCRHADLGLCPIGGREVVCPPDSFGYYSRELSPYGFSVICGGQALGRSYPADTAYNVVMAGKFAILNPKVCAPYLLKLLENRFEIIPVKQGYAKCSVCVVSKAAVITADEGIRRAVERRGIEALKISSSGVLLPPYANGFFGGASGKISGGVLAVNGSLKKMESGTEIFNFLARHGVSVLEIGSDAPFDTGSLIPLLEDDNNKLGTM